MKLGPYDLDQIYTGDARELAKAIPDESVDLIFTDPPYPKEFLPLYGWLSKEASRILKSGGYVFAYGATEFMPQVLDLMRDGGLDYFWVDVLIHNGGYPRIWYKNLMSGYKPIFVFTKGRWKIAPWRSTICADGADKRFHEWGQGEGTGLKDIEMITNVGDVVFDPFCGGGTVPAVCKMLGRHYLAFEIDPDTAERARQRVENTQPPLLIPQPEQVDMFAEAEA